MPIYEYECESCGERKDFIQKMDEAPKKKCPACGKLKLKRLVSSGGFILKGHGWYKDGYGNKPKAGDS